MLYKNEIVFNSRITSCFIRRCVGYAQWSSVKNRGGNMEKLKIALSQMRCEKGDIEKNLKAIEAYSRESSSKGCEIICFPEMSITGYINPLESPESILNLSSSAVKRILDLSRIYNVIIIAGFVEHNSDGKPFITQIAAKDGETACVYRKITIADDEKEWFSPGKNLGIFPYQGINIGLSICADIGNEALFREYAKSEVNIVFESAAPGLYGEQTSRNWQSGFNWWKSECYGKLGKYANDCGVYIAVSTQAGRTIDEDFPGGGYIFSPEGKCLYETKDWSEGMLYGEIVLQWKSDIGKGSNSIKSI
jgi:predicted amidohydrolase